MTPQEIEQVRELSFRKAGIVLDKGKEYLIEARVSALAKKLNYATVSDMMKKTNRLGSDEISRSIVDAMTTNETSFFRDIYPFEALKKHVLPAIMAAKPDKKLNIWCAAASTGQEPYTLAMILKETLPAAGNWQINFMASDLSRDVLDRAKAGKYSQLEVNRGLPAPLLVKYFKKNGMEWEVSPDLRKMINFVEINLLEAWPIMPPLDIVFIRNVLIYFDQPTKAKILGRIRGLMRPDGYLFLGGAETTLNVDDKFERTDMERSGCYRIRRAISAAA